MGLVSYSTKIDKLPSALIYPEEYTLQKIPNSTCHDHDHLLIFFAGQEERNFDTLTVQRPMTNSVNLAVNLEYNLFHIDLIGFSFGRKGSGILIRNGTTTIEPEAKPVAFNVLLRNGVV